MRTPRLRGAATPGLCIALLLLVLVLAPGKAAAYSGRVIDAKTKRPIDGAFQKKTGETACLTFLIFSRRVTRSQLQIWWGHFRRPQRIQVKGGRTENIATT